MCSLNLLCGSFTFFYTLGIACASMELSSVNVALRPLHWFAAYRRPNSRLGCMNIATIRSILRRHGLVYVGFPQTMWDVLLVGKSESDFKIQQ